ncbi:MAG: NUDIX domain-containing protein [Phycisphaeraceae bacterium]
MERDIAWLPQPNEVSLVLCEALPDPAKVTSALAMAFAGDRFLMTRLHKRGWDIPGGHVEVGETLEQAVRREVHEETGATLERLQPFAYQQIRLLGPVPADYRYPAPESFQVFFIAQVADLGTFAATAEAGERRLFAPREAVQVAWVKKHRPFYEAALEHVRAMNQVEQS